MVYIDYVVTWDMLKDKIENGEFNGVARGKATYEKYVKRGAEIREEYCSITDYALIRFLGYPYKEVETISATPSASPTKKKQAVTDQPPPSFTTLLPNDFPYNFPPDVEHLLMWCVRPLARDEIPNYVAPLLKERYGDQKIEVQTFVNSVAAQSIREVFHAHVCVKKVQ